MLLTIQPTKIPTSTPLPHFTEWFSFLLRVFDEWKSTTLAVDVCRSSAFNMFLFGETLADNLSVFEVFRAFEAT